MRIMHAMHILLRCARTTLVTCMRNTAMSETCTAVSRLLQEGVVFNVNSGMIIGVNMPFGMIIGHGLYEIEDASVQSGLYVSSRFRCIQVMHAIGI